MEWLLKKWEAEIFKDEAKAQNTTGYDQMPKIIGINRLSKSNKNQQFQIQITLALNIREHDSFCLNIEQVEGTLGGLKG